MTELHKNNRICPQINPLGLSLAFVLASASGLAAQDREGGLNATLDISQLFENVREEGLVGGDPSSFRSVTALAFGISSQTRSQRLAFGLSTGLAASFDDDSDLTFENNVATLDYSRNSRNAELTFGARYRRDNIDDLVFDDTLADEDITTGVGQREVLTVNSGIVVGRTAKVTTTVTHLYETSEFFDTLDPSLNDSETQQLDARVSFQLSPVLTTDVFALWRQIDEQGTGATDRDLAELGTSAGYRIDPVTTLTAELSYREEESRSATVSQVEGWNYGLNLVRGRSNGDVFVDFNQQEALTGTRRQISAGQNLTFARGALGYSLGVSRTEGYDAQVLAGLSFEYATDRNSTASISLTQEAAVNGDDREVVNSRFALSYARELSPVAGISVGFDLADENVLDAGIADERTYEFDLTFDYDLARDWTLTSGFEYALVRLDGAADRTRSTVFAGLRKSFAYRP